MLASIIIFVPVFNVDCAGVPAIPNKIKIKKKIELYSELSWTNIFFKVSPFY